ncbi:MAG: hypothetical protein JNN22_15205 [Rhodospirillales bacterium]|nr:hypothetical protein [Rhodospirillales bacterium]
MTYAGDGLRKIRAEFKMLNARQVELVSSIVALSFKSDRAKEFAMQGLGRRVGVMIRSIENVFNAIPPELKTPPKREAALDATIGLHSFLINAFGAVENLAWAWVLETGLKKANGRDLSRRDIGLGKGCTLVRNSLPGELRTKIVEFDPWFEYLEDFRHALAHRIPPYFPPSIIRSADIEKYRKIEHLISVNLREGNLAAYAETLARHRALEKFSGILTHSHSEGVRPVFFHAQVLADFATIEDLSKNFIEAFRNLSGTAALKLD